MSVLEIFFACSFISTFAVALLATWLRYVPNLIFSYRVTINHLEHFNPQLNLLPKFNAHKIERRSAQF